MKQIYCPNCGFQRLLEEPPSEDDLNQYPWGDLLCGKCHLVLATIRLAPEEAAGDGQPVVDTEP